ncbi:putative invasin [Vibrio phage pTD1]|uniref:Putative invasin n=1 Tax=Vibrio phage pTD1 TaxID=1938577 RepID=A0A1Q2U303_9CAUD|nr:putative invasin [Vibrio phage pTD1]BAW98369.1 putative invasin [Vibrio phage pTD1]
MIGIIKGNILDAQGRPIVPGKPVTITGVRSDGGDDISVITEPDGTWSFNLTSEKVGECDITFMYNGLEVGSYEVFFVDDLNLTVLPYSSSETHQGHSALIAFAVTDPDGKGVPNAPVTFYDDSSDPNPTATVNTDRFGIVEFLVSPTTESGSLALGPRRFNATIGKTIATHTVEWTTDSKPLTYAISDFMYTDEVEPGGRAVLGGYLLDQNGEVIIQPYNFDIFSKDKLSIISSNFYQDPDGRIIMAPNDQGEGSHRLCFFSDNGRKDVTVTWQDQVSDVIDTVRLTAPDAHVYPTVVDTYVKAIAYNADGEVVKVRNELKFNNTINGSSKSFGIILPDGSLVINAQSDTAKTQRQGVMIDGVSKLDHEFEYRDGLTISKCEYGNDAVPTGQDGFVAFVVTGTNGKAVPAAAVDYIESSGKRHYTNTPVDGNHILEVPISQGGDENRTYEEITAIVGESKAVAGVYWKPASVPVGLTLRDVVFPTQSKDNVAMTITGVLNDQNGAPIKDTKLGIFNVSTLEYQEFGENGAIGDDGSFNINYGPLPIGDHELILAANAVAEHHDTTWIDSVPVFESFRALPWMTESTPEGTEDLIGVAAITADGETAAGVPVTFYRSDFYEVEGEELGTVMTNEYGFAELKVTVDTPLTEAFETVYYLAKYKDKQLRLNYTRSNVRPSVMELANFTINEKTQVGKSAVVKCTAVDKLGTPVSSLQGMHVYHLPSFKAMSVSSPDYVLDGTSVYNVETAEMFGDFKLGVGTHPMVMWHRQSNSRVYFDLVVVDEADVVTPAKIVLTADAPTVGMVNDGGYFPIMAQAQDADGNPFKPAYGIQVAVHRKMDGVDYNGGYAHIGPNGEIYSAVVPNEAGDYTFWFEDQEYEGDAGENYGEFALTFRDDLLVEMSKATTETVAHGEQATLVARAMNQVHQGVANVWVDFYSEEMYGNISGGTTDHLGYATGKVSEAYVVSITDPEIVTIKAKLTDIVESETSIVVTWDGEAKQVVLSDVVVPATALPNKPVAVTGNVQDKDGNLLEGVVVTVTDKLTGIDYVSTPTIGGSFRIDVNMVEEGDHELIVSAGADLVYGTVKVELVIPAYDSVEKLPFSTTRAANDGSVFLAFKATNAGADVVDLPLDLYIQGGAQPIRGTYTDARGYGVLLFNSTEPNSTVMLEVKVGTTVIGVYEVSFTDQPVGSAITEVLNIEPTVNGEAMLFDITVTDQNDAVIANPVIGAFDFTNFTPLTITPDANQHGRGLYTIEGMTDASIEVMIYTENARTQVNSSWVDEPLKEYTAIAIDTHSANPSEGEEVELTGHLLSADDQIVVPNSVVVAKLVDTEGGETLSTIDTEGKFLFPLSYAEYTKKTYTVHVGAVVSESFDIEWGHLVPPEYTSIVWVGEQPSTGEVGTPVKLEAMTLDQYGNPIEGVSVRPFINGTPGDAFRSPPGGKWSFDYNATEAGDVLYEFGWEPNIPRIGHTVTWSLPDPIFTSMEFTQSPTAGTTGTALEVKILTKDQFGNPMAGQSVAWSDGGTNMPARTSDQDGIATFTLNANEVGDVVYNFIGSGPVENLTLTVTWSAPPPVVTSIEITGPETATIAETANVTILTKDQFGQPMPNVSVVWDDGGIPFPQSMTDENGQIAYQFTRDTEEVVTYTFNAGNGVEGTHVINWVSNITGAEGVSIDTMELPLAIAGSTTTLSGTTIIPEIPGAESITVDEMETPMGTTTGTTTISGNAS